MSGVTIFPALSQGYRPELPKQRLWIGKTGEIDGDTTDSAVYQVPAGCQTMITDVVLHPYDNRDGGVRVSTFYMTYGPDATPAVATNNTKLFWYYTIEDGDASHYEYNLNAVMDENDYLWVGSDYDDSAVHATTPDYYSGTGTFVCSILGVEFEI